MINLNEEAEKKIRTLMIEGQMKSWAIVLLLVVYLVAIPLFLLFTYSTKRDVEDTKVMIEKSLAEIKSEVRKKSAEEYKNVVQRFC